MLPGDSGKLCREATGGSTYFFFSKPAQQTSILWTISFIPVPSSGNIEELMNEMLLESNLSIVFTKALRQILRQPVQVRMFFKKREPAGEWQLTGGLIDQCCEAANHRLLIRRTHGRSQFVTRRLLPASCKVLSNDIRIHSSWCAKD